jgi:hypothetical protein
MPRRRIGDRIQELCQRASERDWRSTLSELRKAIREHALQVANRNAAAVVGGMPHLIMERRERQSLPNDWIPSDYESSSNQTVN